MTQPNDERAQIRATGATSAHVAMTEAEQERARVKGSIYVNGVRMDHVRRCSCGRRPKVSTGYEGFDDGTGPFVVSCDHGVPLEQQPDGHLDFSMSRSWSKTRVCRNWNVMMRENAALALIAGDHLKGVE